MPPLLFRRGRVKVRSTPRIRAEIEFVEEASALRDRFAAAAVIGILLDPSRSKDLSYGLLAKAAFEVADRMLEQRAMSPRLHHG